MPFFLICGIFSAVKYIVFTGVFTPKNMTYLHGDDVLMKTENRDFFYFDPAFEGEFADFSNNDIFTPEKRKEFLLHYSDFLRNNYGLSDDSVKPVTESAAKDKCNSVSAPVASPKVSKRIELNDVEAELISKHSGFKNWVFYTNKVAVEGDTVVMKGDPLPPNPGAAYSVCKDCNIKEFHLSFFMEKAYDNGLPVNAILTTTTHRLISVRSGIQDIVNINILPNGVCRVLYPLQDIYNPREYDLGTVKFDEWQSMKIVLDNNSFMVRLGSNEPVELPRKVMESPDLIFFSTGMFNMGDWKVKIDRLVAEKGEGTEFIFPEVVKKESVEKIGAVKLPYSVGNYVNHDKILRLTKEFEAETGAAAKAYITLGSIDPGGRVWLDGELIAETDSFEQLKLDVTELLKKQKNHRLVVEVDPRAPEVLFRWHRNVDPYNGWFCEDITLDIINDIEITEEKAVTLTAGRGKATVNFSCKTSKPCKVNIYISDAWPGTSDEKLIGTYDSNGVMSATVDFDKINLWEAEDPVLYNIRFEAVNEAGIPADDTVIETGFRTVVQKNGGIYINGKKTTMKGALVMQYLPPHSETATTHICPRDWQIVWQYMMLKKMHGNMLRLHILGYGTNDVRFARYADRLGVMLIWITRYIDSVEQMAWEGPWRAKEGYIRQMSLRLNHPSIVIWEGSNEFHPTLSDIDRIHDAYVPAVKAVDTSRLICPLSHHYYAGDNPETSCFNHYSTDGREDAFGREVKAPESWTDPLVVRSAHPYVYSMGYGFSWEPFRTQPWKEQERMANDKDRAYLATEFAVIGRQDPRTKEARELFFQPYSYEFPNENILGFPVSEDDWRISQAYQALCISYSVRKFRIMDFDGMLWCCLMGGANDAGYLKPPIDNYGYAKYGFYTMKENYKTVTCLNDTTDTKRGCGFAVKPVLFAFPGDTRYVTAAVIDENGNEVDTHNFGEIEVFDYMTRLPEWKPSLTTEGYYAVKFTVK